MRYSPLRITAKLITPVAGDFSLPIDGIILAMAARRAYGELPPLAPNEAPKYEPSICPIAIEHEGEDWFYAASFAIWGRYSESAEHWNKRLDTALAEDFTPDAKRVDTGMGHYRAYHSRMQLRHAEHVWWHVLGNRQTIISLLQDCTSIGKKQSQGFGQVAEWCVEDSEADYSIISKNGFVARAVPQSWSVVKSLPINSMVGRRAIRPSYWDVANIRICYVPGKAF